MSKEEKHKARHKARKWKERAKLAEFARRSCAEVCNARRLLLDRVVGACLRYAPPADMLSVVENDYERWVGHVEETLKNDAERALKDEERSERTLRDMRLVSMEAGALRGRLNEIAATLRSWKDPGQRIGDDMLEALALRCLEPL